MLKRKERVGEMAQLVKRMLFKREDPSLNRQNVSEEPGLLVYVSKPSDGDVETGRSLELNWPARLLETVGSRFSNRPWRMAPNNHPWPPHRYIHSSHMYAHLPHPHAVKEKGRKLASRWTAVIFGYTFSFTVYKISVK